MFVFLAAELAENIVALLKRAINKERVNVFFSRHRLERDALDDFCLKKSATRDTHLLQNRDGLVEVVVLHGAGAVDAGQGRLGV